MADRQFGVNRIVKLMGISKATYYASENPIDKLKTKYESIKNFVSKIIKKNPKYGVLRIKAELKDAHQVVIARDTLGSLLKYWSLDLKRKISKPKHNMIQKILLALADRTNLLIRTKIDKPFMAISSDLTELVFKGGKAYLCVHKDVFGQMVYGFSLGMSMKTSLVVSSLKMAQEKVKELVGDSILKLLIHQDRGSQYTSHEYVDKALAWSSLSYSNPGTPTHNPGQESFFGRFKDEWREEIAELETFEQLEKIVKEKIRYYNYERRHTSIGFVSPWKFTKSFLENS